VKEKTLGAMLEKAMKIYKNHTCLGNIYRNLKEKKYAWKSYGEML